MKDPPCFGNLRPGMKDVTLLVAGGGGAGAAPAGGVPAGAVPGGYPEPGSADILTPRCAALLLEQASKGLECERLERHLSFKMWHSRGTQMHARRASPPVCTYPDGGGRADVSTDAKTCDELGRRREGACGKGARAPVHSIHKRAPPPFGSLLLSYRLSHLVASQPLRWGEWAGATAPPPRSTAPRRRAVDPSTAIQRAAAHAMRSGTIANAAIAASSFLSSLSHTLEGCCSLPPQWWGIIELADERRVCCSCRETRVDRPLAPVSSTTASASAAEHARARSLPRSTRARRECGRVRERKSTRKQHSKSNEPLDSRTEGLKNVQTLRFFAVSFETSCQKLYNWQIIVSAR